LIIRKIRGCRCRRVCRATKGILENTYKFFIPKKRFLGLNLFFEALLLQIENGLKANTEGV
jgi:hypothetical protein